MCSKGDDIIKKHEKFWIWFELIFELAIVECVIFECVYFKPTHFNWGYFLIAFASITLILICLLSVDHRFLKRLKEYQEKQHDRWQKAPRYTIQVNTKDNFGYLVWSGATFSLSYIDPDNQDSCTFTKEQINKLKHNSHLAVDWNTAKIERFN